MTSFGWTRLLHFMCNGIQNLHVLGHGWENTICSIMGDTILMYTVSSVHSHLNHACFTLLLTVPNVNNACCSVLDDLRHWFPFIVHRCSLHNIMFACICCMLIQSEVQTDFNVLHYLFTILLDKLILDFHATRKWIDINGCLKGSKIYLKIGNTTTLFAE